MKSQSNKQNKPDPNFHPCVVCGRRAKWRFSPDLDIRGIGACQRDLEDVRMAYIILLGEGGEKMFKSFIEGVKKKRGITKDEPATKEEKTI